MTRFAATRAAGSLVTIIGASILAFVFVRVVPGDPVRLVLGRLATEQAVIAQRNAMGLDESLPVQYWHFISSFLQGDWGFAYSVGEPVRSLIGTRLPASLELGSYAFAIALVGAVLLALWATYRRRRSIDVGVRAISFLGLGTPPFWLALLLLILFSQQWGILPGPEGRLSPHTDAPTTITGFYTIDALLAGDIATFLDAVEHLILPAFVLAFAPFAFLVRLLRANLLEVSREPFITVVRGKGYGRWTAFRRHALPNAALPMLTAAGLVLGELLAGSVLVEKVFDWPGVGALVVESVQRKDYAVVQTFILLAALVYVLVNLAVDILYGVIDPRIRLTRGVRT
jgi:ABC-type dipeptide/oligopeptide/nickel transport system permease component